MPVAVSDSCSRYAYYVLARGTSPCDVSNRAAHCGSTRARPAALVTRQLLVHSSLHTPFRVSVARKAHWQTQHWHAGWYCGMRTIYSTMPMANYALRSMVMRGPGQRSSGIIM